MHEVIDHFLNEILAKRLLKYLLVPEMVSEDVQQLYASNKANRKLVIGQCQLF